MELNVDVTSIKPGDIVHGSRTLETVTYEVTGKVSEVQYTAASFGRKFLIGHSRTLIDANAYEWDLIERIDHMKYIGQTIDYQGVEYIIGGSVDRVAHLFDLKTGDTIQIYWTDIVRLKVIEERDEEDRNRHVEDCD